MPEDRNIDAMLPALIEQLALRVAEHLAPRVADILTHESPTASPWLTTRQAITYTGIPEGTFRKLVASGKIPSHGGKSKIYFRPEVDQALLGYTGIADEQRHLRRVR